MVNQLVSYKTYFGKQFKITNNLQPNGKHI